MKYIKTYENINNNSKDGNFYKIKFPISKIELESIFYKLGENPEQQESTINGILSLAENYIYLAIDIYWEKNSALRIGWGDDRDNSFEMFLKAGFEYCGEIQATQEDVENYKIHLNAKKYNL